MNISVVIPTLNEEDNLPSCLKALLRQKQEGDEIIVVDGGSTDSTIDITKKAAEVDDNVRIFEPDGDYGVGLGEGRHIGTLKANHEVVAQTDADAIPPDGWLEQIRHHFMEDDKLSVLWGNIEDRNGVPIRNMTGKFWSLMGGVSGNNTSYRREHYMEMTEGYPDVDFAEDVILIGKLAWEGKAKRDPALVMRMNMDRKRYQTGPILGWGGASMLTGAYLGGTPGMLLGGVGAGLAGTEMVYEPIAQSMEVPKSEVERQTPHHDAVGMAALGAGGAIGGPVGVAITGVGAGVMGHHWLTEGISASPTGLEQASEVVRTVKDTAELS